MSLQFRAFHRPGPIKDDAEWPLCSDGWVELFERAGGGIPWIGESGQPGFRAGKVQPREAILAHENLTPNFEEPGRRPFQPRWHGANRADVLRDIVTHRPVAAGRGRSERAIFVEQGNRDAVYLWFDDHGYLFVRQEPFETPVKIAHLFFRVGVVEAQHRDPMRHLRKRLQRRAAYFLSRRIRRSQIAGISSRDPRVPDRGRHIPDRRLSGPLLRNSGDCVLRVAPEARRCVYRRRGSSQTRRIIRFHPE